MRPTAATPTGNQLPDATTAAAGVGGRALDALIEDIDTLIEKAATLVSVPDSRDSLTEVDQGQSTAVERRDIAASAPVEATAEAQTPQETLRDPAEAVLDWVAEVAAVNDAIEAAFMAIDAQAVTASDDASVVLERLRQAAARHRVLLETASALRHDTASAVERLRRGRRGRDAYRAAE